jgi:hypothetical protein
VTAFGSQFAEMSNDRKAETEEEIVQRYGQRRHRPARVSTPSASL